jgi:hypothetical protein
MLLYYTILSFDKADVKPKDIWFIILQFIICGGFIYLLFFHAIYYFEATLVLAILFGLLLMIDDSKNDSSDFEFYGYFIIAAFVAVFAFFIIPLIAFIIYFKLDEKDKRMRR